MRECHPCKCKCGNLALPGRDYIHGHHRRGVKNSFEATAKYIESRSKNTESKRNGTYIPPVSKPCKCNCGGLASPGKDYISGHHNKLEQYKSMHKPEIVAKVVKSNTENGNYERHREEWKKNPPMHNCLYKRRAIEGMKNTYKNHPEIVERKVKKLTEKGVYEKVKVFIRELNIRNHSMERYSKHKFLGVPFDSKEEMKIAEILFYKLNVFPIVGESSQVYVSGKFIDFYFFGMFFEHHPKHNFCKTDNGDDYYKKRRMILDNGGFCSFVLLHTESLKEAKEMVDFLYKNLSGYIGTDILEFL